MVALTYGDTRVAPETKPVAAAMPPSFFSRFIAAMMESRMRQARREIALCAPHILPLLPRQDGNTPRGGW
jgi:hypothetical protein